MEFAVPLMSLIRRTAAVAAAAAAAVAAAVICCPAGPLHSLYCCPLQTYPLPIKMKFCAPVWALALALALALCLGSVSANDLQVHAKIYNCRGE
jgi:hypothetical protein